MSTPWANGREIRKLRQLIIDTYGYECHLCHELIDLSISGTHPKGFTIDHVLPRSRGGSNDLANLRPAHRQCNSERGANYLGQRRSPSFSRRFFGHTP